MSTAATSAASRVPSGFSVLSRQAIRRGSFPAVKALMAATDEFIRSWNDGNPPFT